MSRVCIRKLLVKTVIYFFTDMPFLESHSPSFSKKNGLKLLKEKALDMLPKDGRVKLKVGLRILERIMAFKIASHFNSEFTSK